MKDTQLWLAAGLALVLCAGCPRKPAFDLPTTDLGAAGAASRTGTVGDGGLGNVAECDQAPEGVPCGKPGRGMHCVYNACSRNVCGDGVRAEQEQCDDGNQRDHDGCNSRCLTEPPATCGDGIVDPDEECDDGNKVNTDDCTSACKYAVCGDGLVGPGEQCDDGNAIESDGCINACKLARCGDDFVGPGEQCDDGNAIETDACNNACHLTSGKCGNAAIDSGEECDDGNMVQTDACTNACKHAACGDSIVGPGEECDDGNAVQTDACTNACKHAVCGDSIVGPGEECDDGNKVNTDACTNACKHAACGDSIVGPGEECDDGNTVDTDACTNACKSFVVSVLCGNSAVDSGEECDDGNKVNDDACSNVCKSNVCGNSRVDPGEACDGTLGPSGALGLGRSCAVDCKSITDTCRACESAAGHCSNYLGSGIDLIAGCYMDADAAKVQHCVDVVSCARTQKCAYGSRGPELCYCGTLDSAACSAAGAVVNGACKAAFEAAAGSTDPVAVTTNFGNTDLAIGNAVFMLKCDVKYCADTAAGCVP
jgi:cysteine-rich repeat protein